MTEFLSWLELDVRRNPGWVLFAIIDLTKETAPESPWGDGQLAGMIGIINTEPNKLSTEVGSVIVGKKFQRTHITSNATGLLLEWCFDKLGMRRVQWQANARNEPSVNAAKKMGFGFEGVIRWQRILEPSKAEVSESIVRNGVAEKPGRHTAMLSMCWDDWTNGMEVKMKERMARVV